MGPCKFSPKPQSKWPPREWWMVKIEQTLGVLFIVTITILVGITILY